VPGEASAVAAGSVALIVARADGGVLLVDLGARSATPLAVERAAEEPIAFAGDRAGVVVSAADGARLELFDRH